MTFCIFIKLIRVDRFPIFDNYMCLLNLWKMALKDFCCIVHGNRDDRTSGFSGDLKGSVLEGEHSQLLAGIAGPLGKYADGYTIFDVLDRLQDCLQSLFRILAVEEQTVETAHPGGKRRIMLHFLFRDVAGQSPAAAVGKQDIEIAAVVSHEKNSLIGNIFLSDDGCTDSGDLQDLLGGSMETPSVKGRY